MQLRLQVKEAAFSHDPVCIARPRSQLERLAAHGEPTDIISDVDLVGLLQGIAKCRDAEPDPDRRVSFATRAPTAATSALTSASTLASAAASTLASAATSALAAAAALPEPSMGGVTWVRQHDGSLKSHGKTAPKGPHVVTPVRGRSSLSSLSSSSSSS